MRLRGRGDRWSWNVPILLRSSRFAICTFALSSFVAVTPARAQFGLDTFLHQLFFGNSNTHHKHHPHRHRRATGSDSEEDDSALADFPDDEGTRELGEARATGARTACPAQCQRQPFARCGGSSDTEAALGSAAIDEADRDYTTMVDQLMQTLKSKLGDSGHQGDYRDSRANTLTEAILQAKLERFETFIGENWSAERLRGMIIKRVTDEIGGCSKAITAARCRWPISIP